jgi:hypothetical protein
MYQDKCFVSFPQTILRWNGYNFMFWWMKDAEM